MLREWEAAHGPRRDGQKQIEALEERRKASIVSFLNHGVEFGKAHFYNEPPDPNNNEDKSKGENPEAEGEED